MPLLYFVYASPFIHHRRSGKAWCLGANPVGVCVSVDANVAVEPSGGIYSKLQRCNIRVDEELISGFILCAFDALINPILRDCVYNAKSEVGTVKLV